MVRLRVIGAAATICLVLGSVHAFSVFLTPFETRFGIGRGAASLTYSLALVSLTTAVLVGPRITRGLTGTQIMVVVGGLGGIGVTLGALADQIWVVWLGFGGVFGFANGLGYGYGLQAAARAAPGGEGWAMGAVTAAYALGATLAPPVLQAGLATGGSVAALLGLAGAVWVAGLGSALLLRRQAASDRDPTIALDLPPWPQVARLWGLYGSAVGAGLMIIGHTAGIIAATGATWPVWVVPSAVALANMIGSLAGGVWADRRSASALLIGMASIGAVILAVLGAGSPRLSLGALVAGLVTVGAFYGATIAVMPALIAKRYGPALSAAVYGRVFTAWGAAGLAAPWIAGVLFEWDGHYGSAFLWAAALSALAAILAVLDLRR